MSEGPSDTSLILKPAKDIIAENAPEIVAEFRRRLSERPEGDVVLHIGKSIRIDSQGFSVIIGLHKDCAAKGRAFAVKTASRDALRLFRMMSLDRFIHLEEAADDD